MCTIEAPKPVQANNNESPKNQTSAWPSVEQFWALLVQEPIVLRTWQFRGAGLKLQVSWFNSYTAVASTFGANRPLLACNVSPDLHKASSESGWEGWGKWETSLWNVVDLHTKETNVL